MSTGPRVKPIKTEKTEDTRPVLHGEYFPTHELNLAIISKKRSGKTMTIANFLPKLIGRDTKVMLFVSTLEKDPVWQHIVKQLDEKGIPYIAEMDIIDDDGNNLLEEFIAENKHREEPEENKSVPKITPHRPLIMTSNSQVKSSPVEKKSKKPPPTKYKASEWIIILDDLGDRLHDKYLIELLKRNRHFNATVIISTQDLTDIPPKGIRQLDYVMLFKNFSDNKLEELHDKLKLGISMDLFQKLYTYATDPMTKGSNGYEFLLIDRANPAEIYRQSFHTRLATHG